MTREPQIRGAVVPTHVQITYGRGGRSPRARPNPWSPGNPFAGPSAFAHLDGQRTWSEVWAVLPSPFDGDYTLPHIDFDHWPLEYLQVAGRRGRLALEVRAFADGAFRQFAVGRADSRPAAEAEPGPPATGSSTAPCRTSSSCAR